MQLVSTRNSQYRLEASQAVMRGIAPDGGLFVPDHFPDLGDLSRFTKMSYCETAADVLSMFFSDINGLGDITAKAYAAFDCEETAPVVKTGSGEFMMELWHGPTLAFKDMALSVLPRLMTAVLNAQGGKNVLILVATSGDTGKAALEGFCDVDRTKIVVFYPNDGVSEMQRLQMVTQGGSNTYVAAVNGNFDDTQTGVKEIFTDEKFAEIIGEKGYRFSSANSINFGRLAPQIAYYVWAYADLMRKGEITKGERINFVVPTGNFGNILAAYYAKQMGLPVKKLVCASNRNNVLTDFFRKGDYSLERDFYKTMSPSMDILISSNLERLLFELAVRDDQKVRDMMDGLKSGGAYAVGSDALKSLEEDFYADWCSEEETMQAIRKTFNEKGYLLDTHTAVAMHVYEKYRAVDPDTKTVIVSTASPYKFPAEVLASLGEDITDLDTYMLAEKLCEVSGTQMPCQLVAMRDKPQRFTDVYEKQDMREAVMKTL